MDNWQKLCSACVCFYFFCIFYHVNFSHYGKLLLCMERISKCTFCFFLSAHRNLKIQLKVKLLWLASTRNSMRTWPLVSETSKMIIAKNEWMHSVIYLLWQHQWWVLCVCTIIFYSSSAGYYYLSWAILSSFKDQVEFVYGPVHNIWMVFRAF